MEPICQFPFKFSVPKYFLCFKNFFLICFKKCFKKSQNFLFCLLNLVTNLDTNLLRMGSDRKIVKCEPVFISEWKRFFRLSFNYLPHACNFIKIEALAQVLPCEFCKIFKNTFLYTTPLVVVSVSSQNKFIGSAETLSTWGIWLHINNLIFLSFIWEASLSYISVIDI